VPPRCSNTLSRLGPKPDSASKEAINAGLRPSLLNTKSRTPLARCAFSAASGRATTDNVTTSCNGQPSRAAANDTDEGAGKTNRETEDQRRFRCAGVKHFQQIEQGLAERALYVERATMANQKIVPLDQVDPASSPYFSLIIVPGERWQG
jgi:hypothetical protein